MGGRLEHMLDTYNYANFWKRATAISVDSIIIMFINSALYLLVTKPAELDPLDVLIEVNISLWTYIPQAIYYGWFLSSYAQATPGKKMFSIYVVNHDGSKLSFIKGALRGTVGYVVSNILTMGIGFLMALGRANRTALHDMIFSTFVLEGEPHDSFEKSLMNESKYKDIILKAQVEVLAKPKVKVDYEKLISDIENKMKDKAVEQSKEKEAEVKIIEVKPVLKKAQAKPDDSW